MLRLFQKNRKWLYYLTIPLAIVISWLISCSRLDNFSDQDYYKSKEEQTSAQVVIQWNRLLLEMERYCPNYRPPIAARAIAYFEAAAYEAAVPGLPGYQSLSTFFPEIQVPIWDAKLPFSVSTSLNASYYAMARSLYPNLPATYATKRQQLFESLDAINQHLSTPEEYKRSNLYGVEVANNFIDWYQADEYGSTSYLHPYDSSFPVSTAPGSWRPYGIHQYPAMLPYWGKVKPMFLDTAVFSSHPPLPYAEAKNSSLFNQALEIYSVTHSLSEENRWIAEFWSDDHPGLTFTPAGRWISITNQVMEKENPALDKMLETYLKVGFSLFDASLACWKAKYRYQIERPQQYINRLIDPNWAPLIDNPSFPSYPSGHATFGAAASVVLTDLFGAHFTFTDHSHEGRIEFNGTPRSFSSFHEMALENAYSRIPAGVHFRMDCEEGIRLGLQIGRHISKLNLKKQDELVDHLN